MSVEVRVARPDELPAVFDLCARAFARGIGAEWAAAQERDPWRDAGDNLVGVCDGRVVASVRVLARKLAGLEGELRLAGFGNVASDPDVRGQGYIRRVLALAHERNQAAGYDLAMLFTTQPWVYSGGGGFSVLPFSYLDLDLHAPMPSAVEQWTIEAADPRRHLPAMREVYEQFGQDRPGYPVRGGAYWTHSARLTDPTLIRLVFDAEKRPAAYVRVRLWPDGRARFQEFPYTSVDAAYALMADLRHDPRVAHLTSVSGRLPRDHALGRLGVWSVNEEAMARAYTSSGADLIAALRNPSNQRSVYWSGDGF
jgi:predicted N-acetyltransferase YhbS